MKNITLSADEKLIADAHAYAEAHGTTLNDLIRGYLAAVTGRRDPKEVAAEFAREALAHPGRSPDGWRFDREEAHRRGKQM
jgi:hypothetical protein